ncbi:MAG: sensor histidine kinase, partial [Desulfocucumaceae bacterium]
MKKLGLVFKIWLAMFALVVMVLGLSAVFQSGMIERIYLGQQSDRVLDRAGRFARQYQDMGGQAEINRQVEVLAAELDANVLVIDQGAGVISWSTNRGMGMGMGMGMGRKGMGMGYGRMQGPGVPFSQSDVQSVLGGETLVKRGSNQFFEAEVITVGVPIKKGGPVSGAVLVYTPLAPIQANLRSIEEAVIYSLLLGIAASTLLAFLFSRSVTRPILKINEVARAMAGGDYSLKVPIRPDNELGVLADSIDTLSGQLREKMETIERIDATRRNFVASVSHELRTPLTIMQGYTEALMDGMARDDRQRDKYLMNIHEETLRLRRLVDDLLDLRRLESGMISMRMDRADISGMIESVAGQINQAQ